MALTHILILAGAALPFMWLVPARWRPWGLLAGSVLAVGWFQDDFLLPAATILLVVIVWWLVQPQQSSSRDTWLALVIMGVGLGVIWLSIPRPGVLTILPGLGLACVAAISATQLLPAHTHPGRIDAYRRLAILVIGAIVAILFLLKTPPLARFFDLWFQPSTALARNLSWLGFSYLAFRLIGVLLDFRAGLLPPKGLTLRDMAVYALFFPAFTAGPIDRAQRFIPELDKALPLTAPRLVEGTGRITVGVVKKFIIADSLALVTLSPALIEQTHSALGLWLLLYIYAFQIFLDFSGYSDVAIGIGRLYGITLPENFDRPYLQPNIQQFWQHWHITLSQWFRVYFFTPFTRAMIRSPRRIPQPLIVFAAQISTMLLIGLWHGVTANFVLWGLWHGLGLFAYKWIADRTRVWYLQRVSPRPWRRRLMYAASVFITFHFVALGWVFFALPTPHDSLTVLQRLFGG